MNNSTAKGVSLYFQVQEYIRNQINTRVLNPGDKIPSESKLSHFFNVSRTTVRQAIDGLVESGLVERKQGSGTFVSDPTYARNRLHSQPNNTVCKNIFSVFMENDTKNSYENIMSVNIAHILMLKKENLINQSNANQILKLFYEIKDKSPTIVEPSPKLEDYFISIEQFVINKLGMDVGGKLQTGRSRNDFGATVARMNVRDILCRTLHLVIQLREKLLQVAAENEDYIMPGYTHLQPSQPELLSHYIIAVENALCRDTQRLQNAFKSTNICPLGSCSFAGSSFKIDRTYTSEILGFSRPISNSLDAVASRDYMLETASAFSIMTSTIARFTQDLFIWSTKEFSFVEFDDSTCCCSASIPQKKNALSIEHIKSRTASVTSGFIEISMMLKGTGYEHCRDLYETHLAIQRISYQVNSILELTIDILSTCTFKKDAMLQRSKTNFITTTDLVDYLVREEDFSFRISHYIISDLVNSCIDKNITTDRITVEMVNKICCEHAKRPIKITQSQLDDILSPIKSIKNKKSYGSTSFENTKELLSDSSYLLSNNKKMIYRLCSKVSYSKTQLEQLLLAEIN